MPHDASPTARLSLIDVVAQSIGFMGPVFAVSILLPQLVGQNNAGKGAGVAAPLAVLIATVGMLALAWIVAAYARRVHHAGSLYNYVTLGLGKRAGAATGLLYYAGIIALGAAIAVLIGGYVHDNLKAEFDVAPLPIWGWQLVFLAALLAVVHFGVQLSTRTQLVLALVSILVLLVFFVTMLIQLGSDNSLTAFKPSSARDGWGGILFAVLYGVLLFTGFETAANLAEETDDPGRHIPRAVLSSVLIAAVFFTLGTYAQVAGFHFDLGAMAKASGAPLITLGGPESAGGYGSVAVARLLELVVLLDMVAVYIGVSVAATRGVFALARDRWLPRPLATLSPRTGTPLGATALVGVVYLVVIAISHWFPKLVALPGVPGYFSMFSWASTFGSFSLAVTYLLLAVGGPRGLRDHPRRAAVYVASAIGLVTTAGAVFGALYKVPHPTVYAAYAALGWFAVALVLAVVLGGGTRLGQLNPRASATEGLAEGRG